MKRSLLLPVLWFTALTTQAQSDPVVMSVNGVPVTRSEFVLSYHQNNGNGQADRKTVEEYAELYAIYKMKVAAALDARLDTSERGATALRQNEKSHRKSRADQTGGDLSPTVHTGIGQGAEPDCPTG